ncbi:MAG: putative oxygen-independent coproporphyrinogen oxidase [Candidatus Angelobacter sp.]|nr:putative oxygen-independent coproporphyrinogen oxidase [Candidatus Angelobacter sp.]
MQMPLGLYISVPFCKAKCTYCNFASDVFSRAVFDRYIDRVCGEIEHATETAEQMGGLLERSVDSIYLGGGTPTLLEVAQLERLFVTISQNFTIEPEAEITVECAPGTLSPAVLEALQRCRVNRVSLGVQSFVDKEAASVGRLHKRDIVFADIESLRAAGIPNINVDLIAGLPHQTRESWQNSLRELLASGVPHASIYMLEVDEDSRLGRELIAGGQKYHAHFVPEDDLTADFYEASCERLNAVGVEQYEISNFARPGQQSKHNLKYWTRQPYLGFGLDAHSMLPSRSAAGASVRLATTDDYDRFFVAADVKASAVTTEQALEESFFLGLRLNRGVDLGRLREQFGDAANRFGATIDELGADGLLFRSGASLRLTNRGRLLSNEVFGRFIGVERSAVN